MTGKSLKSEPILVTEVENLGLSENISSILEKTHGEIEKVVDINYQEINLFGSFKNWIDLILSPVDPEKWATTLDILKEKRSSSMNVLDKNKKNDDSGFTFSKAA